MDLTRRELCLGFPVALLPALLATEHAQQPAARANGQRRTIPRRAERQAVDG
jgi:hypothetical protein